MTEFEELRPFVLGYIFDILVKVLKYKEDHKGKKILYEYPRMADFAEWCEIVARCIVLATKTMNSSIPIKKIY